MIFLTNVFSNLLGYDGLILIIAAINFFVVFPMLRNTSTKLDQALNPTISKPIEEIIKSLRSPIQGSMDLQLFQQQKQKENLYFQIYIAITSIFPLLGILGTVIAMLLLGDFSSNQVAVNFTQALTSTFWGLICAIFFKSLEGFIAPIVHQNEENLKLLLQRLDQFSRNKVGDRP